MRPMLLPGTNITVRLLGSSPEEWIPTEMSRGTLASTWEFSDEDRARIAAGGVLRIEVSAALLGIAPEVVDIMQARLGSNSDGQ